MLEPRPGALVVDDVYETGFTLNRFINAPNITTFVWFSKVEPIWWKAVEVTSSDEWITFPWENIQTARLDEKGFRQSRRQF